jgi:predicted ATP-dependent protease
MQRLHRYLGSLLVGATLIAPVGIQANDKDRNCPDKGYYDHKDCHNWDDHETRAYQAWEKAQRKTDREFSKLKAKEQSEYWKWRHEHPDNDNDRH